MNTLRLNNDGPVIVETNSGARYQIDETPDGDFVVTALVAPGDVLIIIPQLANQIRLQVDDR